MQNSDPGSRKVIHKADNWEFSLILYRAAFFQIVSLHKLLNRIKLSTFKAPLTYSICEVTVNDLRDNLLNC